MSTLPLGMLKKMLGEEPLSHRLAILMYLKGHTFADIKHTLKMDSKAQVKEITAPYQKYRCTFAVEEIELLMSISDALGLPVK